MVGIEIVSEEPVVFRVEMRSIVEADTFLTAARHLLGLDVARKSDTLFHVYWH